MLTLPQKPPTTPPSKQLGLRRALLIGIALLAGPLILPSTAHAMTPPQNELTFFAFDNHSIPFSRNLSLTMNRPVKFAENPVLPRGEAGAPDHFGVQFYGSVVEDQGKFRMWYVAMDEEFKNWPNVDPTIFRVAYAESSDGIHWVKPKLRLVDYRGSTQNNLIELLPSPLGMINLKVIRDDVDPAPARRYKMILHTWSVGDDGKGGRGTLAPLVSADGFTWHPVKNIHPLKGRLPISEMFLPEHHYEAGSGLYQWQGMYYITGQSNSGHFQHGTTPYSGREVLIHRSADFDHWEPSAHVAFLREGQSGKSFIYGEGEETHEGISVWNRGNVLLGLSGIWHGGKDWPDRTIDLGFVISNDGLHFREPLTEWVIFPRGPDGAWDQGGLIQGQGFANVGDQTYVYYGAWDPRPEVAKVGYPARGGVGLATLERDRFGSFSPRVSGAPADLTTTTIELADGSNPKFFINADGLGTDATLRVDLLDAREQPIPLASGDHAALIRANGLRTPVLFPNVPTLPAAVRLRVSFDGSDSSSIKVSALYIVPGT